MHARASCYARIAGTDEPSVQEALQQMFPETTLRRMKLLPETLLHLCFKGVI
jgi:hypothetical protein